MKKLFKNVATSVKATAVNIKSSVVAFNRRAVCGNAGEGYIDTAVKVLIAVVLGALVLAGLSSAEQTIVSGAIIILAVALSTVANKKKR